MNRFTTTIDAQKTGCPTCTTTRGDGVGSFVGNTQTTGGTQTTEGNQTLVGNFTAFLGDSGNHKELFELVCRLLKADAITTDEAWDLILKIVPREKEYVPYSTGPYIPPAEPWTPVNPNPWYKGWEVWCSAHQSGKGQTGGLGQCDIR